MSRAICLLLALLCVVPHAAWARDPTAAIARAGGVWRLDETATPERPTDLAGLEVDLKASTLGFVYTDETVICPFTITEGGAAFAELRVTCVLDDPANPSVSVIRLTPTGSGGLAVGGAMSENPEGIVHFRQ